ncbi:hypothetical protein [Variovorax sp. RCC_210]|uniref:hypothetical protein n=1 Tax=Variovorax sp. RCC_210 TaxID=3239217 RepID=UPI0035251F94
MKLNTDTKVIIAGVLVLGVGAWYVQRQARAAASGLVDGVAASFDGLYTSLAGGLGGAWDSVGNTISGVGTSIRSGGDAVASALGVQGTIDPVTGDYVPYGAQPNAPPGKPYNVPWYLGGGHSDIFSADGTYLGPGVWGSTATRQAEQADVRRLDNAIADGSYQAPRPWWSYLTLNMAT